jgi:hypothetical protein
MAFLYFQSVIFQLLKKICKDNVNVYYPAFILAKYEELALNYQITHKRIKMS